MERNGNVTFSVLFQDSPETSDNCETIQVRKGRHHTTRERGKKHTRLEILCLYYFHEANSIRENLLVRGWGVREFRICTTVKIASCVRGTSSRASFPRENLTSHIKRSLVQASIFIPRAKRDFYNFSKSNQKEYIRKNNMLYLGCGRIKVWSMFKCVS